ncbi:hypothetical protein BaRGS_00024997 [Batillaria attramentaria]|uniref:Death domain-containing protein n=1 Tax=Batillaria attramentaria TaxID=370345 RepID=A0ABD0K9J4_9CAEN
MVDINRTKQVRFAGNGPPSLKLPALWPAHLKKIAASPHGTPRKSGGSPDVSPRHKAKTTPRAKITPRDKDEPVADDLKEKLRPVLEHRMPTLASKAAFMMPGDDRSALGPGRHPEGLRQLQQDAPPRNMRDVRAAVSKEIKSLTRKVARLEREYYGDKRTIHNDVEQYAYPIKMLMKTLWILDLNKASEVEEMIKQAANPQRYNKDPKFPAALKEVYTKVQTFLPHKISGMVESCQGLLNSLVRYCVSFYDAEKDCYLETAAHYTEQITAWKEKAELSIQSARNLYKKFQTTGITASMLSSPVATFCSRRDINKILFLVMFADACTHIRNALSVMTLWLQADDNYATYVKNDLAELEKLKEEKVKVLQVLRQKVHSVTYKVNQLEQEHGRLSQEVIATREKEEILRIEEVSLVNQLNEMELEIEFKEKRRDNFKRRAASEYGEPTAETYESVTSELKSLKERLPQVVRQLAHVRHKLTWVDEKISTLERIHRDIQAAKDELKNAEEERNLKEEEFEEIEQATQLARKIMLCKTASDAVQKLYYSMPFGVKAARAKGEAKDPLDRACKVISTRIERDWVQLYRNLNFHPHRGAETIERDIVELRESGARASVSLTARHSLDRWKRYHTRANVEDLRQALKKIRRQDILKVVDLGLSPPTKVVDPFEPQEELPPPVEPKLVPFYKQIERYDQLRASRVK